MILEVKVKAFSLHKLHRKTTKDGESNRGERERKEGGKKVAERDRKGQKREE